MTVTPDRRLQQRIFHTAGRRRAVRLEPIFWAGLEEMASQTGVRLGQLIEDAASMPSGAVNLAGAAREMCLAWTMRRAGSHVADASGDAGATAGRLIRSAPLPGLILGPRRQVLELNDAACRWLGATSVDIVGQPVEALLRLSPDRVRRTWAAFAAGSTAADRWPLARILPGRTILGEGRIAPLALTEHGPVAVLWVMSLR